MQVSLRGEIVFLNVVFVIYAAKNDWQIDGTTIQVWLGARATSCSLCVTTGDT